MADETKSCCSGGCDGKNPLSMMVKVIIGLGFLALGGVAILRWWPLLLDLIKAGIGPFLLLAGVITLAIAKE